MERPNRDPYLAPLADTANGVDRTSHQAYEQVNNPNFRDLATPDATYCGASRHRSVNPPIDLSTQSQIVCCPGRVAIHTPRLVKPDSSQKRDTKLMEHTFPGDDGSVRERAPGPIHVVTAVFDEVVEPVAYTCLKLMLFREGASLIHSAHGRVQARPGTLLVVCAGTLCGGIPVRSVRVTTAYVNLDYLLDQLTWRLNGLLLDRHEAETIAAKSFRHNMWGTQLSSEVARHMAGLLDRVEQVQDEGGGFYAIEAPFIKVLEQLVPLLPYGDIPDGPVRSLASIFHRGLVGCEGGVVAVSWGSVCRVGMAFAAMSLAVVGIPGSGWRSGSRRARSDSCWSGAVWSRCQGPQCRDGVDEEMGVGVVVGEVEDACSGVVGEVGWDLVEAVAQSFGLPPAPFMTSKCKGLHPRGEVECELDDVDPDAVLVEGVQGEVTQSGLLGQADAVLTPGSSPVT